MLKSNQLNPKARVIYMYTNRVIPEQRKIKAETNCRDFSDGVFNFWIKIDVFWFQFRLNLFQGSN